MERQDVSVDEATEPKVRRDSRAVVVLLAALVWFSCAWFGSWEWNPNNATRLFGAIALAENGDARIDRFAPLTIDKSLHHGHYYMDKAPGMTLMAVPAVWIADRVSGQTADQLSIAMWDADTERYLRARLRLAAAMTSALLTTLAALALFGLARDACGSEAAGVLAAIGYALGTPAWGWSTTLFGHAATAALLVIATWAVWRGTAGQHARPWFAALAGAALGWGIVVEFSSALFGTIIGVWALVRLWRFPAAERHVACFAAVIPAFAALAVLGSYNVLAFGDPFHLGYQGVVGFEGMQQGLFGLTYPKLDILAQVVVGGRRGLVWVAPVACVGVLGLVQMLRRRRTRGLAAVALAIVAAAVLYNASYVYWDGGNSTGPRHAVPALGFLALGIAPVWASGSRAVRWLVLLVLALSVGLNLVIASAEIMSGSPDPFPIWSEVIQQRFLAGQLRTVANEWWGWSAWSGFVADLVVGLVLGTALIRIVRSRADVTRAESPTPC
jgi:hypothetical protein